MKYYNKKVHFDGHKFDSEAERDRYIVLNLMQRTGKISHLELQKEFEIIPKLVVKEIKHLKTKDKVVYRVEEHAAKYTCDFYYYDNNELCWIIEEFKSPQTAKLTDYILRRKLIKKRISEMNYILPSHANIKFVETISQPVHKTPKKKKK